MSPRPKRFPPRVTKTLYFAVASGYCTLALVRCGLNVCRRAGIAG